MSEPLFSLSTAVPERNYFTVDEQVFYLRGWDEMSIVERASLVKIMRAAGQFARAEGALSEAQGKKISQDMDTFCKIVVVDCPQDLLGKLTLTQKDDVIMAFFERGGMKSHMTKLREANLAQLISENSSPNSNDSTEQEQSSNGS